VVQLQSHRESAVESVTASSRAKRAAIREKLQALAAAEENHSVSNNSRQRGLNSDAECHGCCIREQLWGHRDTSKDRLWSGSATCDCSGGGCEEGESHVDQRYSRGSGGIVIIRVFVCKGAWGGGLIVEFGHVYVSDGLSIRLLRLSFPGKIHLINLGV
jgi:hypothetical protein